jgi:hypothetical protein
VKKFYPYVMALALMSASAVYGLAQTAYGGQPVANAFFQEHREWEEGRRRAQEVGHEDGFNDGRRDFDTHHSFRPTHDGNYKHADHGFDGRFGDRDRYREAYREAYARGYHEGYYRDHR